jgi:hypothetical protein
MSSSNRCSLNHPRLLYLAGADDDRQSTRFTGVVVAIEVTPSLTSQEV